MEEIRTRGNLANDTVGDEGFRFLPPFPVLFLALRFESFRVELLLSLGDRIAVPSGRRVLAISSI